MGLIQWASVLAEGAGGGNPYPLIIGIVIAMFLFVFISGRGKKKERQTREKMLRDLSRNDKVVTIGGLVGVITDVKDDEVTLKIDESSNTKIRTKKWAVRALEAKEGDSGDERK